MINPRELYQWCKVSAHELATHPLRKVPFRLVDDAAQMGVLMAQELIEEVKAHNLQGQPTYAIVPCGPTCWYAPFRAMVNEQKVSLRNLHVFHMDECLDWQGKLLPERHPYNFRTYMEQHFYGGIDSSLAVPEDQRHWLTPDNVDEIRKAIAEVSIDITLGGWGQDGHIAYNQARRHPYHNVGIDELRNSTVRIQENNWDTIIALAQRTFGSAYQFVPPMSVTLGLKECLSARKVRLFSDTGAWKQTALRVALFGPITPEYPITLLQEHPDALITATLDTAKHPIAEHSEWQLF